MGEIIESELSSMELGAKKYFMSKLIPLEKKYLKWEYGNDEEFPAWVVADLRDRDVGIAYCCGGHGASGDRWGIIFLHDNYFGMDVAWYSSLNDLIKDGWYEST